MRVCAGHGPAAIASGLALWCRCGRRGWSRGLRSLYRRFGSCIGADFGPGRSRYGQLRAGRRRCHPVDPRRRRHLRWRKPGLRHLRAWIRAWCKIWRRVGQGWHEGRARRGLGLNACGGRFCLRQGGRRAFGRWPRGRGRNGAGHRGLGAGARRLQRREPGRGSAVGVVTSGGDCHCSRRAATLSGLACKCAISCPPAPGPPPPPGSDRCSARPACNPADRIRKLPISIIRLMAAP
ncbi:hypothetical protein roselon_01009 [Roseibacterium elongatum DSM 19469]|uniref:Uncharacterized protein n=1 Tax=Roseicyclus elongatus DSM 19469 TaxID=1294273 RepID=W8RQK1_9RHOB|nr:hypothetical protein roselon_01009 [Roseibacterium elongatum DSM 19469]